MYGKSKRELKLGIFVFIALIVLVIFVLSIGDFKTWNSGYHIRMKFGFINGVKVGAPVRFAGVDVGEVKEIDIAFNPETQVTEVNILAWVNQKIIIPKDSTVWINTLGLLGEKYVEIMPGKDYARTLKANDVIVGNDAIAMHEVAELAKTIATDLEQGIVRLTNKEGTIGKLLYDDQLYNQLEELVIDIKKHPWKLFRKGK